MKTKIKAALAAVVLLVAVSCKKENNSIQSSTVDNENSMRQNDIASVIIGAQVWMKNNLNVSRYRNGDKIPQVKDAAKWATLTTGAWCWYNNDSATGAVYGKLYNWYAVHDPRGLAPAGWHIPSDSEWHAAGNFLGNTAGGKLKETGTAHWFNPNVDATNSSGFTGLPGGYRSASGQFCYIKYLGLWWTSTEYNISGAWYRRMLCYSAFLDWWRFPKQMGFSVRCIRD
ncbi:MAG TPA: fibrobacter succinogenes major paralogous domain-containing protein [Parafilimonas sp.]|nr:fibrobacter succinogenes major paralogous domain-containing protein [Parafilimonas sp.]